MVPTTRKQVEKISQQQNPVRTLEHNTINPYRKPVITTMQAISNLALNAARLAKSNVQNIQQEPEALSSNSSSRESDLQDMYIETVDPMELLDDISNPNNSVPMFSDNFTTAPVYQTNNNNTSVTANDNSFISNSQHYNNDTNNTDTNNNNDNTVKSPSLTNSNVNPVTNPVNEYDFTKYINNNSSQNEFTSRYTELNAEKFKAGIILKLIPQKTKTEKISFVSSLIAAETNIITLKTETLIQNEKKDVYLTMTFPNLEALNIVLSIDIPIDNPDLENQPHTPLRLQTIIHNKKKTHFNLKDETLKIWDLPFTLNYHNLKANIELRYRKVTYCNTEPTGNYLKTFVCFANPNTISDIISQNYMLIGDEIVQVTSLTQQPLIFNV